LEGQVPELQGLEFAAPSSPPTSSPQEARRPEMSPTPLPHVSPAPSTSASPRQIDAALKRLLIVELKKQTESVLAEVRDATGNFHAIDRLDKVRALPASVSTNVTLLGNQSRDFRTKVGYEVAYYECLADIETIDALVVVDEVTGDLAAKDAPAARQILVGFVKHYSMPSSEELKPLWDYVNSVSALCEKLKDEGATHLRNAQSLESAGKKTQALAEYREIYRIYPNPITAERIKQLENKPR
jgi:hypothetical protein